MAREVSSIQPGTEMYMGRKQFLIVFVFLVLSLVGGLAVEASVDPAVGGETTQPSPRIQVHPGVQQHDEKAGSPTVKVLSLEDVMKVLNSSLPKRLQADIRRPTAAEAEKYGLRPNQGVVLGWLDPKGPLGRAGLNIGDVIIQVDNQPVEDLEYFVSLVDSLEKRQTVTFCVLAHRTQTPRKVRVVVGENPHAQRTRGNFLGRPVEAVVAGFKKAAQTVKQGFGYVADMGRAAYVTVIQGLKKWADETDEDPVASAKKPEEASPNPGVPSKNMVLGPR